MLARRPVDLNEPRELCTVTDDSQELRIRDPESNRRGERGCLLFVLLPVLLWSLFKMIEGLSDGAWGVFAGYLGLAAGCVLLSLAMLRYWYVWGLRIGSGEITVVEKNALGQSRDHRLVRAEQIEALYLAPETSACFVVFAYEPGGQRITLLRQAPEAARTAAERIGRLLGRPVRDAALHASVPRVGLAATAERWLYLQSVKRLKGLRSGQKTMQPGLLDDTKLSLLIFDPVERRVSVKSLQGASDPTTVSPREVHQVEVVEEAPRQVELEDSVGDSYKRWRYAAQTLLRIDGFAEPIPVAEFVRHESTQQAAGSAQVAQEALVIAEHYGRLVGIDTPRRRVDTP